VLDDGRIFNRVEDSNINPKGTWNIVDKENNIKDFNLNGQTPTKGKSKRFKILIIRRYLGIIIS